MTEREALTEGLAALRINCPQGVDKLLRFSELLLEKNRVMNLTAVTDPMEVVTRHFLDCAALVPYITGGKTVVDVGCGAGFPGIPMALLSDAKVTLLDALQKRILWLQEVCENLDISNAEAVHARAEEFGHKGEFDVATSRAVARLNVLAELSLPFVKVGGYFIAMKAEDCAEEVEEARRAIEILGGGEPEIVTYTVPQTDLRRTLVVVKKLRETEAKYPRRFSKISAKPL